METQYLDVLNELISIPERDGRNGAVRSVFDRSLRCDLADGFPLLTTKKLPFRHIAGELLWFLSGSTSVLPLQEQGITIWNEWADEDGEVGPLYGKQMRTWKTYKRFLAGYGRGEGVDQVQNVIASLQSDPFGRRHVWTTWNPADLPEMALPPCHGIAVQFYVTNDRRLCCSMYQRSADWFLGVPFNIASYALLTHLMAREVGMTVGTLTLHFGDVHLYANHLDAAKVQISRTPFPMPALWIETTDHNIFELETKHMQVMTYRAHSLIPASVSR